jgi:hypothetical protein
MSKRKKGTAMVRWVRVLGAIAVIAANAVMASRAQARRSPVTFAPAFHKIATDSQVFTAGRYAVLASGNVFPAVDNLFTHATLIDERTGQRTPLAMPSGCEFENLGPTVAIDGCYTGQAIDVIQELSTRPAHRAPVRAGPRRRHRADRSSLGGGRNV